MAPVARHLVLFLVHLASAVSFFYAAPAVAGTAPEQVPIYKIQGSGDRSRLAGQRVTTWGVVTRVAQGGFFIQDPVGDGDPTTSDGIFVFSAPAPGSAASVGHLVRVTGTVSEFSTGPGTAGRPLTEITGVSAVEFQGSGYRIVPTTVQLPLARGDSFERFEGMLVRFAGTLTVQQNFFLTRYGQLTVGMGRHMTPTNVYRPGTARALDLADLQARSRFLLDDGSSLQNPNPTPFQDADGVPRAGDLVSNLVGVLDHGLATHDKSGPGLYRLHPTEAPVLTTANPRSLEPPPVGGNIKAGAMNVLNFFTTFTNGKTSTGQTGRGCTLGHAPPSASLCRGAGNFSEFQRQRGKLVNAIVGLDADVLGLMEVQNNADEAVQDLVDALNARTGAPTYAVIPAPAQGTGDDAIRVAMIYKPSRLSPIGASVSDPAPVNNRPPMAQTFAASNGERFTLVVNHLKSKSGCPARGDADGDAGDGQGCWNARRLQQAQRLRTFVAQLASDSGVRDTLLVGDFNAYAQEDPIHDLTSNGYVDPAARLEPAGYSYVYDGTAGRLDHAIASSSLAARISGVTHWHIGADEGPHHGYNLAYRQPACAACAPDIFDGGSPYRASDHDPVLVGMNLMKRIRTSQ